MAKDTLRIVTWNVNHRIREKAIPPQMSEALLSLAPDVVVLTEFVPGPTRTPFYDALADGGMSYHLCSETTKGQNHVFIASRARLEAGDVFAPPIDPSLPSNVLHARLPTLGFEVLGIRIPDYSKIPALRRECWDWILRTAVKVKGRPLVLLGDFNTDARYPKARCGDRLGALVEQGWRHAVPATGGSFWTLRGDEVRIDHAFASPHFQVVSAQYLKEENGYNFAGKFAMSDHAALVVDVRPLIGEK